MTRKKKTEVEEIVTAYKGFKQDLTCRGYQFEIGGTYKHEGEVEACASGFHSCEYPLDVFGYYAPGDSRFAIVKASGQLSRHDDDSKIASATLVVEAEISMPTMISRAIDWIMARLDSSVEQTVAGDTASNTGNRSAASNTGNQSAASNTGDYSAASNTGYQSAASNTGYQSAASNTGDYSAASNTGNRSAASNTGYQSAASNTGNRSAASNTGNRSAASNTGDYSAASNTGNRSAASNTGDRSAASNTGYQSAASNTGNRSAASNTGYQSAASNTGDYSAAEVSGKESVAASLGIEGRARASAGSAIVLCHRDDKGHLIHIRASKVGENGVKPDTWYQLSAEGEFVEFDE
ncbi:TPA: hypothetical protein ACMFQU_006503 [Pseudomonas aeruginosa]|uniref:DUF7666 domain-containing protein n=1 Tax=Pseudomonas aeruginosa TaxID=287 RepID=UPI00071B8C9D|nr:hypothetical protein [Pseudomonas aeruginosa]KSN70682.1 hypothetical protein APA90_26375 [Pseudomonas aeruginosa]MCT0606424.1 hypothetical protein [Pseudomonas aeruginosa]RPO81119.1 hypothetical protein IPC1171_32695 [Pseudomonas aeruginosa]TEJ85010.1 hypothetical protein IPC604_16615 [Pseudomonas aeruginosa]TEJ94971.1 hypothetical protein IPC605_17145 [Pseudomonas aeruginosa]